MKEILKKFCDKISYHFQDESLMEEALTHPSLSKENKVRNNYQRLEFLGDKVLGLVIGEFLMQKYPRESEGHLSRRQASLVSGEILSSIALEIGLDEVLQLSRGEENLGGKSNKRNLENAAEAMIGAIYLDSGYEQAKAFILRFWDNLLHQNIEAPKDPVSRLQELVQIKTKKLPKYFTEKIGGSDHAPVFSSRIILPESNLEFEAKGASKKEAQKAASELALRSLISLAKKS